MVATQTQGGAPQACILICTSHQLGKLKVALADRYTIEREVRAPGPDSAERLAAGTRLSGAYIVGLLYVNALTWRVDNALPH